MKTKKIKIGFKDIGTAVDDFVETGGALTRGEHVREEAGVYFTSIEGFRNAITPRRLELLNLIKASRPSSINELALLARRNIKNVADATKLLAQVGLLEIKKVQNRATPKVDYDEINVRIAV